MRPKEKDKKRRAALKITASVIILFTVWFASGILVSDKLQTERIDIKLNGGTVPVKIAHISDIHFPDNKVPVGDIVNTIAAFDPDLVFLTGDILDSSATKEDVGELKNFLTRLKPYRVFAVLGNHELIIRNLKNYKSDLKENGIALLENKAELISVNGREIAIAGISDKEAYGYGSVEGLSSVPAGMPVILLAHRPERWENYLSATDTHKPAAVFSGHAHGGQLKIFGIGVYAPGYGYFPKYYDGLYLDKNTGNALVVSRGLGDTIFPFRLYNRYHIPLVTLKV